MLRITVEIVEAGGAREGGEKEIEVPGEATDWDECIERAITAAADEIEFLKLRKGSDNGYSKT
jgi:hypothetical protein